MPKYKCDDGGLTGLVALMLGILFVTLKLCGLIDWSWWLVTLPLWILPAFAIAIAVVVLVMFLAAFVCVFISAVFVACVEIIARK